MLESLRQTPVASSDAALPTQDAPVSTPRPVAARERVFRDVAEQLVPRLWRVLCRYGLPRQDWDDAVQSVLMQMHRSWGRLEHRSEAEVTAYACCAAAGVARDFARARSRPLQRNKTSLVDEPEDPRGGPEAALQRKEARAEIDAILATMPEERRVVFILYEVEQLTGEQIAEHMGLPRGTVASRLRLARKEFTEAVKRRRAQERA